MNQISCVYVFMDVYEKKKKIHLEEEINAGNEKMDQYLVDVIFNVHKHNHITE